MRTSCILTLRIPCGAGASHFPSDAHTVSATMDEGNVDILPSQMSSPSRGDEMLEYACEPVQVARLNYRLATYGS